MRHFTDRTGAVWDVVLGRESWGTLLALFVPVHGGAVRQAALRAASHDAATQELDQFDEAALQSLLDTAKVREEGSA